MIIKLWFFFTLKVGVGLVPKRGRLLTLAYYAFPRWYECRATMEWYWQGKTEELGEKPVPVPLCPPQIPHGLTQARTRASAVRCQRLTTWAMALLLKVKSKVLCHLTGLIQCMRRNTWGQVSLADFWMQLRESSATASIICHCNYSYRCASVAGIVLSNVYCFVSVRLDVLFKSLLFCQKVLKKMLS
jgi:hypothetical protein